MLRPTGDHHYDSLHENFFGLYSNLLSDGVAFDDLINIIMDKQSSNDIIIPISDFLHIIKLIRGINKSK